MDSGRGAHPMPLYISHRGGAKEGYGASFRQRNGGRSYLVTRDWHYPAQHARSMQVNARCLHFALFVLQFVWSSRTNFEWIEVTPRITATIVTKLGVAQPPPRGKTLKSRFCMRGATVRLWSPVTDKYVMHFRFGTCCRIGGPQIAKLRS
jgi:hypothetical protein